MDKPDTQPDNHPDNNKSVHLLYVKHFDLRGLQGDITFHLCNAVNKVMSWQAIGAQKMKGLWVIAVKSSDARVTLLEKNITIYDNEIKLYADNPYMRKPWDDSERVVVKDYPMWEPNSRILDYFRALPNAELCSNDVHFSKARNLTSGSSSFFNGDRFVYMKSGFDPIPERINIGEYECRVWYASRDVKCKRCGEGHKTTEVTQCKAYCESLPEVEIFKGGPFSNFDKCTTKIGNMTFKTSEHGYQWFACMEHMDADIAEKVYHAKSPLDAKRLAANVKMQNSKVWSIFFLRYDIMKKVLIGKATSSKRFSDALLDSGDKLLVECSATDLYWGSGLDLHLTSTTNPEYYPGLNKLGQVCIG